MPVISSYSKWKVSPLTGIIINLGDLDPVDPDVYDVTYEIQNVKKNSKFSFAEIREDNDTGGFEVIAYEIEIEFTIVQLINYYPNLLKHLKQYKRVFVRPTFGKMSDSAYAYHQTSGLNDIATIYNYSIENVKVETDDTNMETTIKIRGIASIDLTENEYFITFS